MKKPRIIVDVALCQGCNNCFMACKDEHQGNDWPGYSRPQSRHGERWIDLPYNERGQFPQIDVAYRPTLCTHCAEAPCVSRSDGAIYKRADGIVLIDPKKSADRRELVDACPYGMISWSEESSAPQKCTLCAHLLDDGWAEPRCVQACGPGALSLVREDDAGFARLAAAEGLETLRPGGLEGTGVCYKNLARFDSCFITGSVAVKRVGVVDCALGAVVTLDKFGGPADGLPLQTVVADAFGDFKFDGLTPDTGEYLVQIELEGYAPVRLTAVLGHSVSLGTIVVEGEC
jgi:Fe-S-cluster-containing dehydrogenase component